MPLPGQHNLTNALAATAVCLALDVPLGNIKTGLETVKPVPGRLSLKRAKSGWTVIDDTYNANPESMQLMQAAWMKMVKQVMANTEDVGKNFAEEARKMHYGESAERNIRGNASFEETQELLDEGIDVLPLPVPEALKGGLQ